MKQVGVQNRHGTQRQHWYSQAHNKTGIATLRKLNFMGQEMLQIDAVWSKTWADSIFQSVQSSKRTWDNHNKVIWVKPSQFDKVCYILEQHFKDVVLVGFDSRDAQPTVWGKLWLLPGAPQELVSSSYKVLAKLYHPDKGGSNEAMSEINEAYRELMKDFKEQENGD